MLRKLARVSVWLAAPLVLCLGGWTAPAHAAPKKNSPQGHQQADEQRNQQIRQASQQRVQVQQAIQWHQKRIEAARAAEKAALAQAAAAKARVNGMYPQVQTANMQVADEERRVDSLQAALQAVESEVASAEGPASHLVKCQQDLATAKSEFDRLRQSIEAAPDYQEARKAALNADDRAFALDAVQRQFFGQNIDLLQARMTLEAAQRNMDAERRRLSTENPDWVAASEALRAARKGQAEVQQRHETLARQYTTTVALLNRANRTATAAQQAIRETQTAIRQLEARRTDIDRNIRRVESERRRERR